MSVARRVTVTLAIALLAVSFAGEAQQAGRVHRVGWLAGARFPAFDSFRDELRRLGHVEGQNLVIEQRIAETSAALPGMTAELVRARVDVIVATATSAIAAAKTTAPSTPIVFVTGDPIAAGFVTSLARPGGKLTGVAIFAQQLEAKRLELLKETLPKVRVVAVLYQTTSGGLRSLSEAQVAARTLHLTLVAVKADSADEIEQALRTAVDQHAGAMFVLSSPLFNAERERVIRIAVKHRLPAMYEHRDFPDAGGLMSYGPDIHGIYRRVAGYVDRILKGANPAEMPVEQPTRLELIINLKTAKALGLTIPRTVLARADEVAE